MVRSKGFSIIEVVVVLGVLVLLAGVGFMGVRAITSPSQAVVETSSSSSKKKVVEVITTKADLESAEKELGDINFEDEDLDSAESQASL